MGWTIVAAVGIGTGSARPPAASADPCADREAIAASIATLESARTTGAPFEQLVAQGATIEKRILELPPDVEQTCAADLSLLRLTERFDPLRREIVTERRRRQIGAKPWPEPIKVAVLQDRVEIGMTREQVTAAWGEPRKVDVTTITKQEQWTYSGPTYLYFSNGAVVTIARTRRPRD